MKVEHEGFQYEISWKHNNYGNESRPIHIKSKQPVKSSTQCICSILPLSESGKSFLLTDVYKFPLDTQYNKQVGRKESFKAMVSNITDKHLRTILWKAFLGLRGPVIYYHADKPYKLVRETKIKLSDGTWVDGIIYETLYPNPDGKIFVRQREDFFAKFSLYPSSTVPMPKLPQILKK
jgi:hypothetical protein